MPHPPKPIPKNHSIQDSWVTHSTGHQIADNPYSNTTAWRDTRAQKLKRQFIAGDCLPQTKGASSNSSAHYYSEDSSSPGAFDGTPGPDTETETEADSRKRVQTEQRHGDIRNSSSTSAGEYRWVSDAEAKRSQLGVRDIRSFMGVNKRKAEGVHWTEKKLKFVHPVKDEKEVSGSAGSSTSTSTPVSASTPKDAPASESESGHTPVTEKSESQTDQIEEITNLAIPTGQLQQSLPLPRPETSNSTSKTLTGTSIYINGTTLPQISDHKLKHLLVAHGAHVATYMARKGVTHIIAAKPGTTGSGAGGGLAARKLQGEIERGGLRSVKVVGVEWALESIKAGKRLSESRFSVLNVAAKGQRSVRGFFGTA